MILVLFYWRIHSIIHIALASKSYSYAMFRVWGRIENARKSEPILFTYAFKSSSLCVCFFCEWVIFLSVWLIDFSSWFYLYLHVWRRYVRMKRSVYCAWIWRSSKNPFTFSSVFFIHLIDVVLRVCVFIHFLLQKVRCNLLCGYNTFWIGYRFEYDWLALFGSFKI